MPTIVLYLGTMIWILDRFAYPDIAAAMIGGGILVSMSYTLRLMGADFSSIVVFFLWYVGVLVVFFGAAWYVFNWFIDYGVRLID